MNENSSPPAPATLSSWLSSAIKRLESVEVPSARLDCLIMLSDLFAKDKSWVLANLDAELLDARRLRTLNNWLLKREQHIPLAYIRGRVEFYGREFAVTPRVLIPRPETEEMVDLIKSLADLPRDNGYRPLLIDVGTGSGCIGITARLERPELEVWLTDIDEGALSVAKQNFRALKDELRINKHWKMQYYQHDLLKDWHTSRFASIITANLPYVAKGFPISPDANHEPELALFAEDEGYRLIEELLPQAAKVLLPGGYLVLESDPWQQDRIAASAAAHGFSVYDKRLFHLSLRLASPAG